MKIILPMAGRGSRFANRGFAKPKPLIEVKGRPMLYWALQSLREITFSELVLILLAEHEEEYGVIRMVQAWLPEVQVHGVLLQDVTEGQLCTVLAARDYLDAEDVLIAASDTYIPTRIGNTITRLNGKAKGIISTINLPGDRWSFARTESQESQRVVEVAEKVRISDHCSTGLYYFSSGEMLMELGDQMVAEQDKTKGEYYVIPAYQRMIDGGEAVYISPEEEMWDMGTPEAKAEFEAYLDRKPNL